ncbi:MAG: hypothetical protein U0359_12005 [Byssovorax sp.]
MIDRRWTGVAATLAALSLLRCGGSSTGGNATTATTGVTTGAGGSTATTGSGAGGASSTTTSGGGGAPATTGGGGAPATTGSGGSSSSGGGPSMWEALSDEFEDPSTLAHWKVRNVVEGTPAQYTALDIDTSHAGELFILPTEGLWHNTSAGTLVYKLVTGDFVVESSVGAYGSPEGMGSPSGGNALAGLMIRDPVSSPFDEEWLMLAVGRLIGAAGPASVVTHMSATTSSGSAGPVHGLLRLCRHGAEVDMYAKLDGDVDWKLRSKFPQSFGPQFKFTLPDEVQVGLAVSASANASLYAHFDYIRFAPVIGGDCLAPIPPP